MKKLYVGNLNYQTSEDELRDVFADYGSVESVKIITDKFTGDSKGFGFVELSDDDLAMKAIEDLDGQDLNGRAMRVNEARPQENRGGGRGGRHGGGGGRHGGGGRGGRHGGGGGGNRGGGGGNRW